MVYQGVCLTPRYCGWWLGSISFARGPDLDWDLKRASDNFEPSPLRSRYFGFPANRYHRGSRGLVCLEPSGGALRKGLLRPLTLDADRADQPLNGRWSVHIVF
jgi:hypothetical protein